MGRLTSLTLGETKEIAKKNAKKKSLTLSAYIRFLIIEADKNQK